MRDRLSFNQYKIKRKWGRRWQSVASLFGNRELYAHRRDFSLHGPRLNPHIAHARPVNWVLRIKLGVIIVSFVATGILALSHPYFQVSHIEIEGIERLSEGDMRATIDKILQRRRFFVFHNNNYFLLNVSVVRNLLLEKYPLKSIIVQKSFPQNLSVIIEEKISTIIYDNGKEYSYLDGNGMVVEVRLSVEESEWQEIGAHPVTSVATSTSSSSLEVALVNRIHTPNSDRVAEELGDFPIVYDTRGKSVAVNERAVSPETAQGIFTWFNMMIKESTIRPRYFIIDNELGGVVITTGEGWEIRGRVDKDIEKQWNELLLILKNKISRRASLQYVDVRYDGRVYWQ